MRISELKKGSRYNGWYILSDIQKIKSNRQVKYYAIVKCPNCGKEFNANLSPIFYGNSKKCKECHKPRKYKNVYVEKELVAEIHFINAKTGKVEYISTFDKKHMNDIKQYHWGIGSGRNGVYVLNTKNNRTEKNHDRLHRFICGLEYGFDNLEGKVIDHIDRNTLNNQSKNLNIVHGFENNQNSKTFKNNDSGVKGVFWREKSKKWEVSIQSNGKRHYLGLFGDKDEAIKARKEAEKKHHKYLTSLRESDTKTCH